ncbi:hypothetical protein G9C98_002960 [Cotesia typhae]|uniref:Uncharacterized protein n=1 Tax=Cotesia typhae TaxID=2053667 RepID=A0A8J5R4M5_9HYME|nr:hypothetical protein G9C98_002960 [Cotesia typhae]
MSSVIKYQKWIYECQQLIYEAEIRKIRRKRILVALVLNEILMCKNKKNSKKQFWIHPLFKLRSDHGFFEAVFPTLSTHSYKFENYIRISISQFEKLLFLVGPMITKKNAVREPISAAARLLITLR